MINAEIYLKAARLMDKELGYDLGGALAAASKSFLKGFDHFEAYRKYFEYGSLTSKECVLALLLMAAIVESEYDKQTLQII